MPISAVPNYSQRFVAPSQEGAVPAFTCPHCNAFAQQPVVLTAAHMGEVGPTVIRKCSVCNQNTFFWKDELIYPLASPAPQASPDMPPDIQQEYAEAAGVVLTSPRAAAALLRLAMEKLCKAISGKATLDKAIASLLADGVILPRVQQALDVIRVVGNNSVHPGQIDVNDDRDTAMTLFDLVNLVVEYGISKPHKVQKLYESLPEASRAAIERRDQG